MFDKFGDTNSTRVPRSSVFEGSLARDLDWKTFVPKVYLYRHTMLLFWPMFIFRGRRETFDSFLALNVVLAGKIGHFFIRVAGVVLAARC